MSDKNTLKGKSVFVMGGGKFGTNALRYLKTKEAKVLVVDINPNCKAKPEADIQAYSLDAWNSLKNGQPAFLAGDAYKLLLDLLQTSVPDFVVTAIQGNTIANVVQNWFTKNGFKSEPYLEGVSKVLENLPKSMVFVNENTAFIAASYMYPDKRCKTNCTAPKNVCALTGRPKPATIESLLKFAVFGVADHCILFSSPLLTAGLGAINGNDLSSLFKKLETFPKPFTLALGTACDCHGVVSLIKTTK
ncbi:MAG: hypothetical protein QCH99_06560 [Candidatus Bathyarchaeota archaeon]|nr:hypothetical protein [Candidatus Bathyarchaeum tardum]